MLLPRVAPCFFVFILAVLLPARALATTDNQADDPAPYLLEYQVTLSESSSKAKVSVYLPDASQIKLIDFNLNEKIHSKVKGNGELDLKKNGRAKWQPPATDALLSFEVELNHERSDGAYDSLHTADYVIFRGDDLIPAARVRTEPGAASKATLTFTLPESWGSVNSGWEKTEAGYFLVDNPARSFDRPTGWFIAGKLGTRRERLEKTHIAVSAPLVNGLERMDVLTFVMLVWPEFEQAFINLPPKVLIIGAGDPFWRGGLSGPNSLFIHADRPLVSENGTSTPVHELFHTVTGIQGAKNDDWIAEGLAEYYSFELLYRAGGLTAERRERVIAWLDNWSGDVTHLRGKRSSGEITAKAALLFDALDREIQNKTNQKKSLDHLTRSLMQKGRVSFKKLKNACQEIIDGDCTTLTTDLLKLDTE